jgi:hypothetical protein
MTLRNRFLARGDAMRVVASTDPADSPNRVTFAGSPPNCDVLLNPLQGCNLIEKAVIPRTVVGRLRGQFGMGEETHGAKAVIERNYDHTMGCKSDAVVAIFRSAANPVAATVQPHHHRQARLMRPVGHPGIQKKTILRR